MSVVSVLPPRFLPALFPMCGAIKALATCGSSHCGQVNKPEVDCWSKVSLSLNQPSNPWPFEHCREYLIIVRQRFSVKGLVRSLYIGILHNDAKHYERKI